ncbi:hypothetical protein DRO02_03815 [archaeon]|nr:MAG: hypothetical protein DRO02_03815 [archaeon]
MLICRSKALSKYTKYKFIFINGIHTEKHQSRQKLIDVTRKVDGKYGVCCLLVDSKMVFSPLHVISAIEHAARASVDGKRDLKVEISLYLLATTQISEALEKVLSEGSRDFCVLILAEDENSAHAAFREITEILEGSVHPDLVETHTRDKLRCQEEAYGIKLDASHNEVERTLLEKIAISRL